MPLDYSWRSAPITDIMTKLSKPENGRIMKTGVTGLSHDRTVWKDSRHYRPWKDRQATAKLLNALDMKVLAYDTSRATPERNWQSM